MVLRVIHESHDADRTGSQTEIFLHMIVICKGKSRRTDLFGENLRLEFFMSRHQEKVKLWLLSVAEEEIFAVAAPFMTDSAGKRSENIGIELLDEGKKDRCAIRITPDEEWLKDPERVYPVIVDPITTTSKDVKEIIDACVDSQDAAGTDREGMYLKTRGGDIIQRSYLKFKLPMIKTGDMVINARMLMVSLAKDGKEVKEVPMETHVAPLSEKTVSLPIPVQNLPGEYAVTVSFRLKEDTVWAKRGHEVAFGQGVYKVEAPAKAVKPARFEVIRSGHDFGVRGENFDVLFSYLNGGLASYRYGGVEMIQMIPRPNFWRAPVDNDNGSLMQMRCGQWKLASMYLSHKYPTGGHYPGMHIPEIEVLDDSAKIKFTYAMPTTPATECKLSYQVYGDGSIRTTLTYDPVEGLGDMPEFGVMFKFDADYDNVTWYGMGPEETYVDRCEGAKLGIYRNKVEDNMAKYMVPQECGNKVGVRWASVTDRKGRGMLFTGDAMEFSALPYTPHEMENAMHPFELPQVHYTVVRVSKQQMGIAGDDSWGAKPLPEYLIKTDEKMEFTFTFKGI